MIWPTANPLVVQQHQQTNTLHLWLWDCTDFALQLPSLEKLLSADEASRSQGFRSYLDRARYTISHGLLRRILGAYLACDPDGIVFGRGALGKPYIVAEAAQRAIHFSFSRSGELGLLAVSSGGPVGVDLQAVEVCSDAAGSTILSAEEQAIVGRADASARSAAMLRCWVRKEALLKAEGCGLTVPMRSFSVLGSSEDAGRPSRSGQWTVTDLDICRGYAGALAAPAATKSIEHYRLT